MASSKNVKSDNKNRPFKFFIDQSMKIFQFLIDDYNMEVLDPGIYGFECSVTFRRHRELAVTIMYEAGTMPWVLFTTVMKVKGELQSEEFALDFVIEELCPSIKIDEYEYGELNEDRMTSVLSQYANALKECCTDILKGDFSIVPKIMERKRAYEKRLRKEQFE